MTPDPGVILHADLNSRPQTTMKPVLVVNIVSLPSPHAPSKWSSGTHQGIGAKVCVLLALKDVTDNHEEAAKVAPQTLRLCQMVRGRMHLSQCY